MNAKAVRKPFKLVLNVTSEDIRKHFKDRLHERKCPAAAVLRRELAKRPDLGRVAPAVWERAVYLTGRGWRTHWQATITEKDRLNYLRTVCARTLEGTRPYTLHLSFKPVKVS